jgi:hypothetical protein
MEEDRGEEEGWRARGEKKRKGRRGGGAARDFGYSRPGFSLNTSYSCF